MEKASKSCKLSTYDGCEFFAKEVGCLYHNKPCIYDIVNNPEDYTDEDLDELDEEALGELFLLSYKQEMEELKNFTLGTGEIPERIADKNVENYIAYVNGYKTFEQFVEDEELL